MAVSRGAGTGGTRGADPAVLVVTHAKIGAEMTGFVRALLGDLPRLEEFSVASLSMDAIQEKISAWADAKAAARPKLVLTDLVNGSGTLAALTVARSRPIDVITGLNVPMLLRAVSPGASAATVLKAGREGAARIKAGRK